MIRDFGHEVSQEEKERFSKYGSQESYQAISMYFGALIGAQNMNDILTKENLQAILSEPKSIDGCHILTAKDATSGTEVMKASIDRYVLSSEEFLDIVTGKATATIFHHVDMDGYASAAVVYNMFNSLQSNPENVFLCSYNYKGDYIRKTVERSNMYTDHNKKKYAFVVDLALTPDDMIYILGEYDKVIWIDHHSTSLEYFDDMITMAVEHKKHHPMDIAFIVDTRISAALMAWNLFVNHAFNIRIEDVLEDDNTLMQLVSVYDTKADVQFPGIYKYALYLNQYYNDMRGLDINSPIWFKLMKDRSLVMNAINAGQQLYEVYMKKIEIQFQNECHYSYNANNVTNLHIKGMAGSGNSLRFSPSENYEDDINLLIRYQGTSFTISGYTGNHQFMDNIGIGKVFKKYFGGGGHPGAAGISGVTMDDLESGFSKLPAEYARGTSDITCDADFEKEKSSYLRFDGEISRAFNIVAKVLVYEWEKSNGYLDPEEK